MRTGRLVFSIVIDLESKSREVENFFKDKQIKPNHFFFIPDEDQISPKRIDPTLKRYLDELRKKGEINRAIVSTEPKAHKIYLDYFSSRNIPCLTDKPVIALPGLSYKKGVADKQYAQISKMDGKILVQTQRREHQAYKFIFEQAEKIILEHHVPITYFHIYHCDGTWNMPGEFNSRENHPYKYGYGKLMHSGYHFVDLAAWIAEKNKHVSKNITISSKAEFLSPAMQYEQLHGKDLYFKFFKKKTEAPSKTKLGELDCYATVKMYDKQKRFISHGTIDLLQSGFSKRAWFDLPKDTYKSNGRLRHEMVNLTIGPLCSIQLHSYQSDETGKSDLFGIGGEEHLDVYIFKNTKLIGGKDKEVVHFGEMINKDNQHHSFYIGQNELPRYTIFKHLIDNTPCSVSLKQQLLTNRLLSDFYKSVVEKKEITTKL